MLDLTGGFGVDSYHFSQNFLSLVYCEKQKELAEIAAHNFTILGADNIKVCPVDGMEYLRESDRSFDVIYLDPSRRIKSGKRFFQLEDMLPPLPACLSLIWPHTDLVMIKTSPLLDISSGIADLGSVKEVHVLAVDNEVKELIWILETGFTSEPELIAINRLAEEDQRMSFRWSEEKQAVSRFHNPLEYIYEPNAALMKAGAFGLLSKRFDLYKLHPNTHLYTSGTLIRFPGRRYKVREVYHYKPKLIKSLRLDRAHVICRNFPETVESIRKKFQLKDGGDSSLIFTTQEDSTYICIHCERIPDAE